MIFLINRILIMIIAHFQRIVFIKTPYFPFDLKGGRIWARRKSSLSLTFLEKETETGVKWLPEASSSQALDSSPTHMCLRGWKHPEINCSGNTGDKSHKPMAHTRISVLSNIPATPFLLVLGAQRDFSLPHILPCSSERTSLASLLEFPLGRWWDSLFTSSTLEYHAHPAGV